MDDLPELVFVDALLTCENPQCPVFGSQLSVEVPLGVERIVCGPCGEGIVKIVEVSP